MKQLVLDIAPAPVPTLDNFVAGANDELLAALRALAAGGVGERFVYVWGGHGSGKSHLLHALAGEFAKQQRTALLIEGASAVAAAFAADAQLFAIDDVDRLDAGAQIALFNLHNRLRAADGVLVASGNAPPAQLTLRADVATRLATGLVYHVHELTDDEKAAALDRHASERGFRLSREVSDYLLRHVRRDLPSLLAVIEALDRYSLETKRAVTVPLLREILQLPLDLGP
jgi:DnaA-homolog protein